MITENPLRRRYYTRDLMKAIKRANEFNEEEKLGDDPWVASIESNSIDASLYPDHVLVGMDVVKLYAVLLHDHEGYFLGSLPIKCDVIMDANGCLQPSTLIT